MGNTAPIRTHLAHTQTALGHSWAPNTWRAAFRMRPSATAFDPAVRVGIATGLALVVGGALGQPQLAALAALGAIASAFARQEPYLRRAGKVAIAGGFVLAGVLLGALLGSTPMLLQIAALSAAAGLAVWVLTSLRIFGPGAVVVVFSAAAASVADSLPRAVLATAIGVLLGLLIAVVPVTRVADTARTPWLSEGFTRLRSAEMLGAGARILAASALAGWASLAIGLQHPLWATMGAVAAMQSVTFASTVERAIQRLLGNVVGAVVAIALIALGLGFWPTVVVIIALQVFTELFVLKNYALATAAITPMALLMISLAGQMTTEMAVSRVADTAIGVVIGVLVAAITISMADRQHISPA
ncbi:FUSC family protein [Tomitella biformata]|uniref:FUSC family protein n=1 Tax=Tomitella biformata TaxID=630403 RepID=UPI000465D30C|nr:FUSC family protein [Tomitella biformata]